MVFIWTESLTPVYDKRRKRKGQNLVNICTFTMKYLLPVKPDCMCM